MKRPALLAVLLVLGAALPAQADHDETERRLKSVGIGAPLRERIHTAIDRGVAYLLTQQRKSGSFRSNWPYANYFQSGIAALSGLALRHADTKPAREAAARTIAWLKGKDGKGRKALHKQIYTGGIAAMLCMADRGPRDLGCAIARGIGESQRTKSGWWGYMITDSTTTMSLAHVDISNLSTTQFAALGLWAGDRLGADIPRKVWRRHLDGLLRVQRKNGSWSYFASRTPGRTYWTGTFMGYANLLLSIAALKDEIAVDPKLRKKVAISRLLGLSALRRDGRLFLAQFAQLTVPDFYALYALEKACLFANLETLGDMPWYRTGAEALLDLQSADGGWGGSVMGPTSRRAAKRSASDAVPSAFALLFLLRSSAVYRPTTPRSVGGEPPEPPTTPRAK